MAPGEYTPLTFSGPVLLAGVTQMGGKPNKGTKKDRRLKGNKKKSKK